MPRKPGPKPRHPFFDALYRLRFRVLGDSYAEFAKRLGISGASLHNWMSAKFAPGPESLVKLALLAQGHDREDLAQVFRKEVERKLPGVERLYK